MVVLIVSNPNTPLNPLPPPTVPTVVVLPTLTPTATPTVTPTSSATPSVTPTDTATPTATASGTPTSSPTPTPTFTQVVFGAGGQTPQAVAPPTTAPLDDGSGAIVPGSEAATLPAVGTPVPVPTHSPFPFTTREVRYDPNSGPEGCQWLSIAGTVTGINSEPVAGLAVEINGENFNEVLFSGSSARWGDSGFEFNLGAAPRTATYTLRLLGPTGGPVSELIYVDTGNTCQRNVAIVEFVQNHPY
jgi:hypothetical protein